MIEFFSVGCNSADTIVDVAAVEFRFGAVVLITKLVFNISYKKIGIARSHSNLVPRAYSAFKMVERRNVLAKNNLVTAFPVHLAWTGECERGILNG